MATLTRLPLHIRFDTPDKAVGVFNGSPKAPRGCDVSISIGIFYKENPLDLTNVSSLHFEIASGEKPESPRLVSKVIAAEDFATAILDKAQFLAGSAAHVVINLSGDELNPDLGNAASKNYYVILSGITTTGTRIAYGKGQFTIFEDGTSDTVTPTPEISAPTYLTAAQIMALLASLPAGGGGGDPIDYAVTARVGGTAGCLDAIATVALLKPKVKLILIGGALKGYSLSASTDAADGEAIVRPTDYNAATNPYQWISCL